MAASRKTLPMDHPVIVTFLLFTVIGFMSLAAEFLKPLALAVLLSFALVPICAFLERLKIPRFLAAVLTVLAAIAAIGAVGYKLGSQLEQLAKGLPEYESHVLTKIERFRPGGGGTIENVKKFVGNVSETLSSTVSEQARVTNVRIIGDRSTVLTEFLQTAGPYLRMIGEFAFVLILVLFLMSGRDDLSDRLVRSFGRGKISLTTKTMGEVAHRISRYLITFAAVNSCVGIIVGLGLWAIGLPFALVWGVFAALLRFVPYAGPGTAFALPLLFSIAHFPTWQGPMLVIALFAILEIAANSFLEPMIYGRTTGVSALGLLVAAMFWTWLWGALGLLLSTPLTVCLAVLGKYVPALRVFGTFLGEETIFKPDVRFYQRLLAGDQDGAAEIVEEVLADTPRVRLFDEILIPTLSMVERDAVRNDIEEETRNFSWWVVDGIILDIEATPPSESESEPPKVKSKSRAAIPEPKAIDTARIVAVPSNDRGDHLVLRMLETLLETAGAPMTVMDSTKTPLELVERISEEQPTMIVISHLPPSGLTTTRYLVRRLRARFPDVPILVGRWAETGDRGSAGEQLSKAGATQVVFSLAEARDRILLHVNPSDAEPKFAEPSANLVPAH